MKVHNVQIYNNRISFKNNRKVANIKPQKQSPIQDGIKTTGAWLGFGLGFDHVCRKFVIFKNSPVKNSLCVNGIIALAAGGYTYIKDKFNMSK